MKTTRKYLFALLGIIAIIAFTNPARAQAPIYEAQTLGSFIVNTNANTNINYVIDCRKQKVVMLQIDNQMQTAETAAQTLSYARSVDGLTYATTATTTNITPVGVTVGTTLIPVETLGAGYIKLTAYTNGAATRSTNTIKYGIKISAP